MLDLEGVAIIGMACRYPGGVESPEALWRLVLDGGCAVSEMPNDRGWDLERLLDTDHKQPGTSRTRFGSFVHNGTCFDPEFFGIAEAEARAMHPAQRLALVTAWEAIERAGIVPASLRGTDLGVYVGTAGPEYGPHWHDAPREVRGRMLTGTTPSVFSGRISYVLGVHGPSMTVDTACSASLAAIHLAVRALRSGEAPLALAGGTTFHSLPGVFTEFSRQRGLSPDGTCKSFAESADGTGWADGAGMLLLARHSDALRLGYPVLGLIRGSALNSDGASPTLTAPNGAAQEMVIRQALADAGLGPADVDAVEAHGTGTKLGDPIEAGALIATYGADRDPRRPLWLGSLKSNIGHTIAAAGVGGVIKMVHALRDGVLPKTLHVNEPNSRIDRSTGTLALITEQRPWPGYGRPRRAAVSSFGISGTNAHLILEQAPAPEEATEPGPAAAPVPWVLSARTPEALRAQAARLAAHVAARPDARVADIGHALATGRSRFEYRAALVGESLPALRSVLDAFVAGEESDAVYTGRAGTAPAPVFVFPGQGSQWPGMARELAATSETFAGHLRECAEALAPYCDAGVLDVLRPGAAEPDLDRVDVVQPALFAVMVALARTWESYGVRPAAVVGHSQGEIAAACVAGALSLADAAKVVALRSRAIGTLPGGYGMASVAMSADEVERYLAARDGGPSIAVVNGPRATVLGGTEAQLRAVVEDLEAAGIQTRILPVDYASHTTQVEAIEAEIRDALAGIAAVTSRVPFQSAVTGERFDTTGLDAGYWYRNLRGAVRFDKAVRGLLNAGHRAFIEVSPHPVLLQPVEETAEEAGVEDLVAVATLRRDDGGAGRFARAVAEAHVRGIEFDGDAVFAPWEPRHHELPTYPFENRRLWLDHRRPGDTGASAGMDPVAHPWLRTATLLPDTGGHLFTGSLSRAAARWLSDHTVHGQVVVPGAAVAELALAAAAEVGCAGLEELTHLRPLVVPERGAVRLHVAVGPPEVDGERTVRVYGRGDDPDAVWIRYADGRLVLDAGPVTDSGTEPPADAEAVDPGSLYRQIARTAIGYGDAFRAVTAARRDGDVLFAEVALPPGLDTGRAGHGLHPVLLDAALHVLAAAAPDDAPGATLVPFSWSGVRLYATGATALRVRLDRTDPGTVRITATDPAGRLVLHADALTLAAADRIPTGPAPRSLYAPVWRPIRVRDTASPLEIWPVGTGGDDAVVRTLAKLRSFLADDGERRLVVVTRGAVATRPGEVVDPALSAVCGLVRSAQSENPGRLSLVDVDDATRSIELAGAAAATGEPHVAVRAGTAYAVRLTRTIGGTASFAAAAAGTVLVTGGTGTLGRVIARHLVAAHGVRHLLLTSRRGTEAPGAQELVAELTSLGATVEVAAADVGFRDDVARLLDGIPAGRPLTAVVHCAATLADGLVESMTREQLRTALAAKADGARHLDELTRSNPVAAFVLFSSCAAGFGSIGQGAYAAANAYVEGLAARRRIDGLPGTALAWGFWEQRSDLTEAVDPTALRRLAPGVPVAPLDTDEALALFDAAWCALEPVTFPVRLAEPEPGAPVAPLLRELVRADPRRSGAAASGSAAGPEPGLLPALRSCGEAARRAMLVDLVRERTATVLGCAASAVSPQRPFRELGVDSLASLELRNRLSAAVGRRLAAAAVFDHPTPAKLAAHIARLIVPEASEPVPRPPAPVAGAGTVADADLDAMDLDALLALTPEANDD